MCFAANGNLLIVDQRGACVQEVTLAGEFVRYIGAGVAAGGAFSLAVDERTVAMALGKVATIHLKCVV